MSTHDAGGSVRRAIESIQNQTFRDFELIVVDAGSTDSTVRLLDSLAERDLRIQVVHADACNRQEALDLALERAGGRYLVVADAAHAQRLFASTLPLGARAAATSRSWTPTAVPAPACSPSSWALQRRARSSWR